MPKKILGRDVPPKQDGDVLDAADINKASIFGDGSDGSYSSGDNLEPGSVYHFTDFTLQSGDTLQAATTPSSEPIIVLVQGDVAIEGTIDLEGAGFDTTRGNMEVGGNDPRGYGTPGGDANAPNFEPNNGNAGRAGNMYPRGDYMSLTAGLPIALPGTGGGTAGTNDSTDTGAFGGGGGASYFANGNGGNSNVVGSGGIKGQTSTPGKGGGAIVFICGGDLTFHGTLDISGEDAGDVDTSNLDAGGGGGGAGMAYLGYAGALTNNGTTVVAGGSGGSTGGDGADGGDGANGTVIFEAIA